MLFRSDKEDWSQTIQDLNDGRIKTPFDEFGNYRHREPVDTDKESEDSEEPPDVHKVFSDYDGDGSSQGSSDDSSLDTRQDLGSIDRGVGRAAQGVQ